MQGHIKPDSTLTALEIDAFANVTEAVLNHGKFLETDFEVLFPNDPFPSDIIVAGDFNADGSYLSNTKQSNLIYTTNPAYFWVVEDNTDTTVAQSANTYDRIIIRGDNIMASVCDEVKVEAFDKNLVPSADWGTFRFDDMFNAINTAANEAYEIKHVSDHYPVFVTLY
jgi:endonuclease/exonuclease/phosphatase family metal-dependent hydrolase